MSTSTPEPTSPEPTEPEPSVTEPSDPGETGTATEPDDGQDPPEGTPQHEWIER